MLYNKVAGQAFSFTHFPFLQQLIIWYSHCIHTDIYHSELSLQHTLHFYHTTFIPCYVSQLSGDVLTHLKFMSFLPSNILHWR